MNTPDKDHKYSISAIVPVYMAKNFLLELYERLERVLSSLCTDFEIIFVEDCGGDGSWEIIEQIARKDSRVKGIKLSKNFGQHAAILCGIREAAFDTIVTLDDDLQHPPETIPSLIDKLSEGYDVVYGVPEKERHGFLRNIASRFTKLAMHTIMRVETARNVSAFRVFRTCLREAFRDFFSPFVSIDVLLTWGTNNFGSVKVPHNIRQGGTSGYSFSKLASHAMNMILGFSIIPLRIATIVGFFFTLFGICVLGYVLVKFLIVGSSVPGFPFLASVIAIFSGAQLFALGILGEYIGYIFYRTMRKPTYVVRTGTESEA
jgi:undecaprenyl-phosphate 4-deoxy-4-formamido-L-arabinose transferase